VAAYLENLEYSGISLSVENSWNSQGILCNLRENILTNEIVSVRSNICKKTAVDWVNRIIMISGSNDPAQ